MTGGQPEQAVLVGVQRAGVPMWEVNDNLDELEQLSRTAGAEPSFRLVQDKGHPNAGTFIGKGKVEEIRDLIEAFGVDLVIFDDDLTPAQARNLENTLKCRIIDRSGLILDIFARRAQTMESRIQVELAQLQYLRPRLTRRWQHFSRQFGGVGSRGAIGIRGPGETQLETDRRVIGLRISSLKRDLAKIEKARATRRSHRRRFFKVALIGYTNAGKSTLLNALTKSDVFVEDLLFATLDPTVRALRLPTGQRVLLIDTVGFIRKLPVDLLVTFRSTLEESLSADLLVNVVDLAHPHWEEQFARTDEIIKELKLDATPQLIAFNKVDLVDDPTLLDGLRRQFPEALFISALRGIRLWEVPQRISVFAERQWVRGTRAFSPDEGEQLRRFETQVKVMGRTFREGLILVDYLVAVEGTGKSKVLSC